MSWPQWQGALQPGVGTVPTATVLNPAPAVINPAAAMPVGMQYTPEQWQQMQQQNWQQWAQWQQQYQQWQQQYGAQYEKTLSAMTNPAAASGVAAAAVMPMTMTTAPPPLPQETKPPLPPEEPPASSSAPSYPPQSYTSTDSANQLNFWKNQPPPNVQDFSGKREFPDPKNKKPDFLDSKLNKSYQDQHKRSDFPDSNQDSNINPGLKRQASSEFQDPKRNKLDSTGNSDELSEGEKKFMKQFAEWEAQFNKWKEQNQDHPDKAQYKEYEKKWEAWRNQLLERREQMRRRRLGLAAQGGDGKRMPPVNMNKPPPNMTSSNVNPNMPNINTSTMPPNMTMNSGNNPERSMSLTSPHSSNFPQATTSKPPPSHFTSTPPAVTKQTHAPPITFPEDDNAGDSFLKSSNTAGGIPGLDLVDAPSKADSPRPEEIAAVDKSKNQKAPVPDLEALSKNINSILGDTKLLSMLGLVTQNQNQIQSVEPAQNVQPASEQGSVIMDDMSRSSFNQDVDSRSQNWSGDQQDYRDSEGDFRNRHDYPREDFDNFGRGRGGAIGDYGGGRGAPGGDFRNGRAGRGDFGGGRGTPLGRGNFNRRPGGDYNSPALGGRDFGPGDDFESRGPDGGRGRGFGTNRGSDSDFKGHFRAGLVFDEGDFINRGRNQNDFDNGSGASGDFDNKRAGGDFGNNRDIDNRSGDFDNTRGGFGGDFRNNRGENFGPGTDFGNNRGRPAEDFDNNRAGNSRTGPAGDFGNNRAGVGGDFGNRRPGPGGDFGNNRSVPGRGGPGEDFRNTRSGPGEDFGINRGGPGGNFINNRDFGNSRGAPDDFGINRSGDFGNNRGAPPDFDNRPPPYGDFGNRNDFSRPGGNNRNDFGDFRNNRLGPDRIGSNSSFNDNYGGFGDDFSRRQREEDYDDYNNPDDYRYRDEYEERGGPVWEDPPKNFDEQDPNIASEAPDDEEFLKIEKVIDYEHKSKKPAVSEITIVPPHLFDYRHKPVNRIPLPDRPKWLKEAFKAYPEFEPAIGRPNYNMRYVPVDRSNYCPAPIYDRYGDIPSYDRRPTPISSEDSRRKRLYEERSKERRPRDVDRRIDDYAGEGRRGDFDRRDDFDRRRNDDDFDRRRNDDDFDRRRNDEDRRRDVDDFDRRRDGDDFSSSRKRDTDDFDRRRDVDFDRRRNVDFDRRKDIDFDSKRRDVDFDSRRRDVDFDSNRRKDAEFDSNRRRDADFNNSKRRDEVTKRPQNTISIDDILNQPGRFKRPSRIVIILRGPPGSGKTFLAKLIKDKEVENGGSAPRILSLDDYFMVEQEKESMEEGKKVMIKEMVYEYEECMENSYRTSLLKSFKKNITDGYFPFIIVDNVNDKTKYFSEMWSFAKENGFEVYICQLELDVQICSKRNVHSRTEKEIESIVSGWEPTPSHYTLLDATNLIQAGSIPEVEMEEINSPNDNFEDESEENEEQACSRSKWDNFECSINNLAKLDGISKPLRPASTMEDYLQLDEWKQPESQPGKKRVRWADLEERREQEKMRAIGFVVGQTDWGRMMDPTQGGSALTKTKYIERVRNK